MAKEEAAAIVWGQGTRVMVREGVLDARALHAHTPSVGLTDVQASPTDAKKGAHPPGHSLPHLHHTALCAHRHTHTHTHFLHSHAQCAHTRSPHAHAHMCTYRHM